MPSVLVQEILTAADMKIMRQVIPTTCHHQKLQIMVLATISSAQGTVGEESCKIAAYFAIFIFKLFMKRVVGVRAQYLGER